MRSRSEVIMEETEELDQVVHRVAALDLGKKELVACVRVPSDRPGRRLQEVRSYPVFSRSLLELADWLRAERVSRVAMEATSDYWKPVFYLLEAEGFECWLLNPRHVRHLPGRPKTDILDAVWLAKVVERGMCQPSLVHPAPIRQLRDLTRYRRTLIRDRTRERQRLEKLLEDAQIKLSSVISDILGVSGRAMLEAMIGGNRNPRALAQLARTRMRTKIDALEEALTGHFTDHHAFLTRTMIDRIDRISLDVDRVSTAIEEAVVPFRAEAQRLDEITGIGVRSAQELIAEIGVDMTRFPTPAHLVSWAKFAPVVHQSAATTRNGSTGKGNPWLAVTLGEIVDGVSRTHTFLGQRYRRLARRRGKKRAIVAVGNSVLKIIWHLLSNPEARYQDLGQDYYATRHTTRRRRTLIRDLERLTGQKVTLQPHAA
jgi:transposase